MTPLRSLVAATLLFLSTTDAYFYLVQPPPLEGDKPELESQIFAPCGGARSPDLSKPTADFHVDGDLVAIILGQKQANIMIGASLNPKGTADWVQLFPIVQQTGEGNFCQPSVTAPKDFVGKTGYIGLVLNGAEVLFQCAAVNFVSGANKVVSSTCTNGTGVSVSFISDSKLSSLIGNAPDSTNGTSGTNSTSGTNNTTSPSDATPLLLRDGRLPVAGFATLAVMILAGATLL